VCSEFQRTPSRESPKRTCAVASGVASFQLLDIWLFILWRPAIPTEADAKTIMAPDRNRLDV